MTTVRTRFAPSPTGSLHLGNLRIAIFNHLLARHHGGRFILRIEDTDLERNVEGAVEGILSDLRWAGLEWDEGPDVGGGHGPYRQSARGRSHHLAALRLEAAGRAYRCFCTDEEVAAARTETTSGPECPGRCRGLGSGEIRARTEAGPPPVLRFAVPDDTISFRDEVRGDIHWEGSDIGDFVILRGDQRATYNFAVVVDDIAMEITHVIRGAGHLSNTPKQALLFDALEAPRPVFAHLPTVLGPDGRKLSKREGAPGVEELAREGYHPDGVVNYLSLLGWSPGDDREILSRRELAELMDLDRVGASDTVFDPEKLRWASAQHIATMPLDELVEAVTPRLDRSRYPLSDSELPNAVDAIRTRLTTFAEVNQHLALLFPDSETFAAGYVELAREENAEATLRAVREHLEEVEDWDPETLSGAVREAGQVAGARGRALFHPVRLALTGARKGPDLGQVLAGVGPRRTMERLAQALDELAA